VTEGSSFGELSWLSKSTTNQKPFRKIIKHRRFSMISDDFPQTPKNALSKRCMVLREGRYERCRYKRRGGIVLKAF
jgi:hypothetical protein